MGGDGEEQWEGGGAVGWRGAERGGVAEGDGERGNGRRSEGGGAKDEGGKGEGEEGEEGRGQWGREAREGLIMRVRVRSMGAWRGDREIGR